ncbi:MAG TPA: type I phosphomannose isomerase catalytic subunit [Flavobacteriaceae bacterium]|nr:type I phosphomannose isomerase catalytic subunit [Flavobacteriaceae bacterium]
MNTPLYPIKFHPILKDKIWGGNKLKTILNKEHNLLNAGESWEISDVEGDTSVVANGDLAGKTLKDLLSEYTSDLLGEKIYKEFGNKFPLLIKFIDAKEDLSIQLHPNDDLAKKRHNSFGKTEMWYVMQADEGSNLIIDFNKKITPEVYLKHLEDKTLPSILNFEQVKSGDTYFIEVGRVHAIGAGVMLAEIQQTSDITYRVYDWDRVDSQGNLRELHNDLAIDAIGFDMPDNFRANYSKTENTSNVMVSCPYFTTHFLPVTKTIKKQNSQDSFIIYMCVKGQVEIEANGFKTKAKMGETVLVPASLKDITIHTETPSELLEVYIK